MAFLGDMAARIAHNVKNPLSSMKTLVQLLERDASLPERARQDCGMVIAEIDRLNNNVSQLLRYAKQARATDRPCDLEGVVRRVLVMSQAEADRLRVKLDCSVACASSRVEGGEEAATDIVSNLVVNALEFDPCGRQSHGPHCAGWRGGRSRRAPGGGRRARSCARNAREDFPALLYDPAWRDGPRSGHREAAGRGGWQFGGVRQPFGRQRGRAFCCEFPPRRLRRFFWSAAACCRLHSGQLAGRLGVAPTFRSASIVLTPPCGVSATRNPRASFAGEKRQQAAAVQNACGALRGKHALRPDCR